MTASAWQGYSNYPTTRPVSRVALAYLKLMLMASWSVALASPNSVAIDVKAVNSQISIRDASGLEYSLVNSIKDRGHESGGTEMSHDGRRIAFSVQMFPTLDVQHPKSAAEHGGAFSDGTPPSRRGNHLMIVSVLGRSAEGNRPRLLADPGADSWSPSWSPDDGTIAFYSNEGGSVQVWLYDVAQGSRRKLSEDRIRVQLGSAMDAPCWSADGSTLFVSKVSARVSDGAAARLNPYLRSPGDVSDARAWAIKTSDRDIAGSTLVSIDVRSGRETSLPSNGAINILHSLSVSPSGNWLTTLTDDYKLSVIDLASQKSYALGEMTALPYGPDDYAGPYWSPRSDTLAYVSGNQLMVLDLTHGIATPKAVGLNLGDIAWHYDASKDLYDDNLKPPAFTSDGRDLLGLALRNDVPNLLVIPVDGGPAIQIPLRGGRPVNRAEDDRDLRGEVYRIDLLRSRENEAWQPERDHVLVQYADYDSAETVVDDVEITKGQVKNVVRRHAEFSVVGSLPDGDAIALYQDFSTPGNFFKLSKKLRFDSAPIVPIEVPAALISALRRARVSIVSTVVPSRLGALRKVTASIVRPARSTSDHGRVIVSVYPHYQGFWEINRFSDSVGGADVLPIATYLVSGYTLLLPHTLGLGPYKETIEQIDTEGLVDSILPQIYRAADLGLIDIKRVGIIGYSQGGHAAVAAITATHLFRAAVSVSGVRLAPFDRVMSMEGDKSHYLGTDQFIDGLIRMLDNAPYFRAGTILTPILLTHGDADSTFHSSELMVDALRGRNANFEFVPYHNMAHDISMWPQSEQLDLATRIIEFFDKHLSNSN